MRATADPPALRSIHAQQPLGTAHRLPHSCAVEVISRPAVVRPGLAAVWRLPVAADAPGKEQHLRVGFAAHGGSSAGHPGIREAPRKPGLTTALPCCAWACPAGTWGAAACGPSQSACSGPPTPAPAPLCPAARQTRHSETVRSVTAAGACQRRQCTALSRRPTHALCPAGARPSTPRACGLCKVRGRSRSSNRTPAPSVRSLSRTQAPPSHLYDHGRRVPQGTARSLVQPPVREPRHVVGGLHRGPVRLPFAQVTCPATRRATKPRELS